MVLVVLIIATFGLATAVSAGPASDSPSTEVATDSISVRQEHMQGMEEKLKALHEALFPNLESNETLAAVKAHSEMMAALAGQVEEKFAVPGGPGKTSAKKSIWDEKAQFSKAAQTLATRIDEFRDALDAGDMDVARAAYDHIDIEGACKLCHDQYRDD